MRLHYEEHGRREGPPLVLVHGMTGSGRWWQPLRDAFGEHHRLIVPDLRGTRTRTTPVALR
jgi:pimeloyl-ACP methyl ester carboxylesterase